MKALGMIETQDSVGAVQAFSPITNFANISTHGLKEIAYLLSVHVNYLPSPETFTFVSREDKK